MEDQCQVEPSTHEYCAARFSKINITVWIGLALSFMTIIFGFGIYASKIQNYDRDIEDIKVKIVEIPVLKDNVSGIKSDISEIKNDIKTLLRR